MNEKDKILKDISLTLCIPLDIVKEIVKSQFSFIAKVISIGNRTEPDTLKNINMQYFGKFAVKETRKRYYEKLDDRTESDD